MPDAVGRGAVSTIFRWMGRIGGILVLGGVVAIFVGEGGFDPLKLTLIEQIMKVIFLLSCTGLIVGWIWEGTGGAISTLAMLAFFLMEFIVNHRFPPGWAFEAIALPGLFFILAALTRRTSDKAASDESAKL